MLDENTLTNIRESGIVQGSQIATDRWRTLTETYGFRVAEKAEYAFIASCFNPFMEATDMICFRKLLDYFKVDYTMLPKENCCGNVLFRQAIDEKNDKDLKESDQVVPEFLENNLKQARAAGADKLLLYCAGCDMMYENYKKQVAETILWYPTLLAEHFKGGQMDLEADYYPGCHFYRRKFNNTTPDLDSVMNILNRIDGFKLNHLNHRLCCSKPKQTDALIAEIKNSIIITPCSGCALFLRQALHGKGDYRIVMVPELLWACVNSRAL